MMIMIMAARNLFNIIIRIFLFHPITLAPLSLNFIPQKNTEISFISKYVGKQYLDNTSKNSEALILIICRM